MKKPQGLYVVDLGKKKMTVDFYGLCLLKAIAAGYKTSKRDDKSFTISTIRAVMGTLGMIVGHEKLTDRNIQQVDSQLMDRLKPFRDNEIVMVRGKNDITLRCPEYINMEKLSSISASTPERARREDPPAKPKSSIHREIQFGKINIVSPKINTDEVSPLPASTHERARREDPPAKPNSTSHSPIGVKEIVMDIPKDRPKARDIDVSHGFEPKTNPEHKLFLLHKVKEALDKNNGNPVRISEFVAFLNSDATFSKILASKEKRGVSVAVTQWLRNFLGAGRELIDYADKHLISVTPAGLSVLASGVITTSKNAPKQRPPKVAGNGTRDWPSRSVTPEPDADGEEGETPVDEEEKIKQLIKDREVEIRDLNDKLVQLLVKKRRDCLVNINRLEGEMLLANEELQGVTEQLRELSPTALAEEEANERRDRIESSSVSCTAFDDLQFRRQSI